MSSLLQSPLRVTERGIEIYLTLNYVMNTHYYGLRVPLYRIWRKPAGMWGCWVLIRINGEKVPMDFSVPYNVKKLPRDAQLISNEEADKYWSGS